MRSTPAQSLPMRYSLLAGSPVARLVVALLLSLPGATAAHAQSGRVAGKVTDSRTAAPVVGATVEVEGLRLGAVTDAEGRYRIANVPSGAQVLVARRIGYAEMRQSITVNAGAEATADFNISSAPVALDRVVVTGTAGGEKLRSIGSSVATIDAAKAVELAAPPTLGSLLNARAPGLIINPSTGRLGSGPSINIRGRSSLGQGNSPLVYIDGVRVNNATGIGAPAGGFGAQGGSVAGRLDDINPEDIESIEVIKGPAASTMYGTEASNGVIQIITKKGAVGAKPVFSMQVTGGSIFLRDAENRVPTNYFKDSSGTIVAWNGVQQEKARGAPLFTTGTAQGYNGSISGGREQLRYFASASYDDEKGVEPNNYVKQFSLHSNLNVAASSKLDLGTSLHYVDKRSHLGTDLGASAMLGTVVGHRLLFPNTRGFGLGFPPELTWALWDNTDEANRFTASGTANHRPLSWLTQRLTAGVDYAAGDTRFLERFAPPDLARFLTPTGALGRITQTLRRSLNFTGDYNATAAAQISSALSSSSSIGVQLLRSDNRATSGGGTGFPAPGVETISGTSVPVAQAQSEVVNTTVGAYAQQKFGWNDRLYATVALRVDNNSAFGEDFKWITYPKADVSWVVNEESFWPQNRWLNTLRLRGAYGESGQAPSAFAALRTFSPIQGPGGAPAVTPGSAGNPDLKPERSKELEVGFETSILDRLTIDFTHYRKRTVDQIVNQAVAPSSGFPGSIPLNLGRVDNSGYELLATLLAVARQNFEWEIVGNLARTDDIVKDLGVVPNAITAHGTTNRVGFPLQGIWSKRIVSADRNPTTGLATNVLCDGGVGAQPVACAQAPFVYLGRSAPHVSGALTNTVTIAKWLRLYALVDFKRGQLRFNTDKALRCTGAVGGLLCEENHYPERFTPLKLASTVGNALTTNIADQYYEKGSFAKLREVSASVTIPTRWVPGASQATFTLSGRELHTWTKFTGTDPENNGQAILPPLSRINATLNIRF
jgi:TonB-linked SusC/RagA family outer membrane protein